MKITAVTDQNGRLLASIMEQIAERRDPESPVAMVRPDFGQVFHALEVPDGFRDLSPDALHRALRPYLPAAQLPCHTLVTDANGRLLASIVESQLAAPGADQPAAMVKPDVGQVLHRLDHPATSTLCS